MSIAVSGYPDGDWCCSPGSAFAQCVQLSTLPPPHVHATLTCHTIIIMVIMIMTMVIMIMIMVIMIMIMVIMIMIMVIMLYSSLPRM